MKEYLLLGVVTLGIGLKEVLRWLPEDSENWSGKVSNFRFQQLSPDIIRLTFVAKIRHNVNDPVKTSVRTSIWRQESSGWKMVFHQGTALNNDN